MQLEFHLFDAEGNPAHRNSETKQWNAFAHTSKKRRKDRARGFITVICPKGTPYVGEKCDILIYPPIALDIMSRRVQIRALFNQKNILLCDMAINIARERSVAVGKTNYISDELNLDDYKNIENVLRRAILRFLRKAP